MTAPATHQCPGGCGTQVEPDLLACKPCWALLPRWLRDAVNGAYRRRVRWPRDAGAATAHRAAVDRALAWYRDNTRSRP